MSDEPPTKKTRKSNPVPAVMRITREKATELYDRRRRDVTIVTYNQANEALHCWNDNGMIQNGYPSVSYSHDEANIQVSHLALRVTNGDEGVPKRSQSETASHLCHNKLCIRPSHIVKESIGQNGRRNNCLAFVVCPHGTRINACGHTPRCILPFDKTNLL